MQELVAREAEDHQAILLVLLVKGLKLLVLRGQAALAGDVDDHHHLALVLAEIDLLTIQRLHLEIQSSGLVGGGRQFQSSWRKLLR